MTNNKRDKYFLIGCLMIFVSQVIMAKDVYYNLSTASDKYNTKYFYCNFHICPTDDDEVFYIDTVLPTAFVVETNALENGDKIDFVYNKTKFFRIKKKRGYYSFGTVTTKAKFQDEQKLSLYYVNNKLIVYIDDTKIFVKQLQINIQKKIGIKWHNIGNLTSHFLCCYEPIPFHLSDYGKEMDNPDFFKESKLMMITQNVGEIYNISFSSDTICHSLFSTRFEYRFNDTKMNNMTSTQRGRSEISGVWSHSPMNKWIIEFDLYIPMETLDDEEYFEIITQIHEGSNKSTTPAFYLSILNGTLKYNLRGDELLIDKWDGKEHPIYRNSGELSYLEKNRWFHIKVFLKEACLKELLPLTKIWIDNKLVLETYAPNCYIFTPRKPENYSYFKFGIYKPGWMLLRECIPNLSKRIYFFDNIMVYN